MSPSVMTRIPILIGIILAIGICSEAIGQVQPLKPDPLEKTLQVDRPSEPTSEDTVFVIILAPELIEGEKSIR